MDSGISQQFALVGRFLRPETRWIYIQNRAPWRYYLAISIWRNGIFRMHNPRSFQRRMKTIILDYFKGSSGDCSNATSSFSNLVSCLGEPGILRGLDNALVGFSLEIGPSRREGIGVLNTKWCRGTNGQKCRRRWTKSCKVHGLA